MQGEYHVVGIKAGSTSRMRRLHKQLSFPYKCNQSARLSCLMLVVFLLVATCTGWATHIANKWPGYPGFYFLSIGDFGTGSDVQMAVARQMGVTAANYNVEFVVGVGDNFYQSGIVGLDDPQLKEKFENIYLHPALQVPWYIALGDHDQRGSVAAQVAYSSLSNRWRMPAPYYVKRIVSEYGGQTLDLIFTDSVGLEGAILKPNEERRFQKDYNESFAGAEAGRAQLRWLEQVLAESTADWRIVVSHRPMRSCADRSRFPVEERLHKTLAPLLNKYGVHVYMHGHDHIGQHLEEKGLVHIGNGVGGFDTHHATANELTVWFNNTYHGFLLHHVTAQQLEFMFMDYNGTILHKAVVKQKLAISCQERYDLI